LNRNGESGHPCLIPDYQGNAFSFSQLSMMLAICFLYIAFIIMKYISSIPWFLRSFIMKSDRMQGFISMFLYLLRLFFFCPKLWSMLEKFHGLLRRMNIVQLLYEIFYRHQLGPFDLLCHLVLGFIFDFFVWMTYYWQ
jgi:hypothetical protein